MLAHLARVMDHAPVAHGFVLGVRRVEIRFEGDLGIDHDGLAAG
jgi:hypothetical protein